MEFWQTTHPKFWIVGARLAPCPVFHFQELSAIKPLSSDLPLNPRPAGAFGRPRAADATGGGGADTAPSPAQVTNQWP